MLRRTRGFRWACRAFPIGLSAARADQDVTHPVPYHLRFRNTDCEQAVVEHGLHLRRIR